MVLPSAKSFRGFARVVNCYFLQCDPAARTFKEMEAIFVITKNIAPLIAARGDMIPGSRANDPQWSCHGPNPFGDSLALSIVTFYNVTPLVSGIHQHIRVQANCEP